MVDMWGRTSTNEWNRAARFFCKLELWRIAMLWTICVISSYFKLFVRSLSGQKSISFPRMKPAPMPTSGSRRPVCIITGAASGLGAAAAHALSKEGFFLVLVDRSVHLLSKTVSDIREQNEDAHLKAFEVDLSSFSSIMEFSFSLEQWLKESDLHSSIQLLINNAGILAVSSRRTADGLDEYISNHSAVFMFFEKTFLGYPCNIDG